MVNRVIFEIELFDAKRSGQPFGAHERRAAGMQADTRLAIDRQEFTVAPEVGFAAGDFFPANRSLNRVVVIMNFQRAEAALTNIERRLRIFPAAFSALETDDKTHDGSFLFLQAGC